jgi:hypothetical protein
MNLNPKIFSKLTLNTWKGKALKQKGKPQDNFDFSLSNFRNQTTSSSKILKILIITYPRSPIL